jgi:hypothetical protein
MKKRKDEPNYALAYTKQRTASKFIGKSHVMTPHQQFLAEITQLSKLVEKGSRQSGRLDYSLAEQRLNAVDSLKAFSIDKALSNTEHIVIKSNLNGDVFMGARGTQPKTKIQSGEFSGRGEASMWASILLNEKIAGSPYRFDQFQDSRTTLINTLEKYGKINEIATYSMGSAKMIPLADEFGIKTTNFNPQIGAEIMNMKSKNPQIQHDVISTQSNVSDVMATLKNTDINLNRLIVKATRQSAGNEILDIMNPFSSHSQNQFLAQGNRDMALAQIQKPVQTSIEKQGQMIMRQETIKAIEANLPYTEFISQFNSGGTGDTRINSLTGKLELIPARTGQGSAFERIYTEEFNRLNNADINRPIKLPFTPTEAEVIRTSVAPEQQIQFLHTADEIRAIQSATTPEARIALQNTAMEAHIGLQTQADILQGQLNNLELTTPYRETIPNRIAGNVNLQNVLHGGLNLGSGLAGAYIGNKALEGLGVDLAGMNPYQSALIQAETQAVVSEGISTTGRAILSGGVRGAFNPTGALLNLATAGVGSQVQALYTNEVANLMTDAGADRRATEIVSQTVGGFSGALFAEAVIPTSALLIEGLGVVAGITAIETAGATIGSLFTPVGTAIGIALATVISAGFAIESAFHRYNAYMLNPDRLQREDTLIGNDPRIQAIVKQLNDSGDYSPENLRRVETSIATQVERLKDENVIRKDYDFRTRLTEVNREFQEASPNAVIQGATYGNSLINNGIASATEQVGIDRENARIQLDEDILANMSAPVATQGTQVRNIIKSDSQIEALSKAGDITGVNNRVRQIFIENKDRNHTFNDAINRDDPVIPQYRGSGVVENVAFSDIRVN